MEEVSRWDSTGGAGNAKTGIVGDGESDTSGYNTGVGCSNFRRLGGGVSLLSSSSRNRLLFVEVTMRGPSSEDTWDCIVMAGPRSRLSFPSCGSSTSSSCAFQDFRIFSARSLTPRKSECSCGRSSSKAITRLRTS